MNARGGAAGFDQALMYYDINWLAYRAYLERGGQTCELLSEEPIDLDRLAARWIVCEERKRVLA